MLGTVTAIDLYQEPVNPQWAKLLDLHERNVQDDRWEGGELHTAERLWVVARRRRSAVWHVPQRRLSCVASF